MRRQHAPARVAAWVMALWVLAAGAGSLAAAGSQPPPAPGAPQEAQDQFVPVKSLPAQEQLPAAPLLLAAYAFVWVVLLVYVWTVWRRVQRVEQEMRELSARLAEHAQGK